MKQQTVMEHYLVPMVLVCLNIAVIHLIYHASAAEALVNLNGGVILAAVSFLLFSLYNRKVWLVTGAMVFYTFVLCMSFY